MMNDRARVALRPFIPSAKFFRYITSLGLAAAGSLAAATAQADVFDFNDDFGDTNPNMVVGIPMGATMSQDSSSGVTATITASDSANLLWFELHANDGIVRYDGTAPSTTNLVITFSAPVNVSTLKFYIASDADTGNFTFDPDVGTTITVPATDANAGTGTFTPDFLTLGQGWDGVSSITMSYDGGDWEPGVDHIVFTTGGGGGGGGGGSTPTLTSATYDASTGALAVTGTNFTATSGLANDVVASKFTLTGHGPATHTLTNTPNVEITSPTQFTLTLSATDREAVNVLLNKNGTAATDATTYDLGGAAGFIAAAAIVSDNGGNGVTVSNSKPVVTSAKISLSGASGLSGAYVIGDTVTATWDNTMFTGNRNANISTVTANFSQFGGGASVAATNDGFGSWSATYTITAGAIDATNRNVSITANDSNSQSTTTAGATNATVDNIALVVSDAHIAISGGSGPGGAYLIGDTVTATWNNTPSGDNNADTVAVVTVDFSEFGGGASVAATNNSGTWTATYQIVTGSINAGNRNIAVTAQDNAGNLTTRADTTNASVDNTGAVPSLTFTTQPSVSSKTQTSVTIGFKLSGTTDNVRAMARFVASAAPTAAEVIAGTGGVGTAPAKTAATGADQSFTISGLTAGTAFRIYVATETGAVLATTLDVTTSATPLAFTTQPSISSKTDTSVTVSFKLSGTTDNVRAMARAAASAAPTAAEVIAGTGGVGTAPAKAAATGADQSFTISGLTAGTAYKIYVATETGAVLATTLDVTTSATPLTFTAQPSVSSKTDTSVTVSFKLSGTTDNVRAMARAAASAAPTAAEVIAGTGGVGTTPAKVAAAGADQTFTISGLTAGTAYKIYVATETGAVLATALDVTTASATGFSVQPFLSGTTSTSITVDYKIVTTGNVHVAAYTSASSPTAAQVAAGTGTGFVASGGGGLVWSGMNWGTLITGLSPGTTYYIYAATGGVVSNVVVATTAAPLSFTTQPAASSLTHNSVTISFKVSGTGDNVRALVRTAASAAPTAAEVIAGTGGVGTAPAKAATTGADQAITISGLDPGTAYRIYVALETTNILANVVNVTTGEAPEPPEPPAPSNPFDSPDGTDRNVTLPDGGAPTKAPSDIVTNLDKLDSRVGISDNGVVVVLDNGIKEPVKFRDNPPDNVLISMPSQKPLDVQLNGNTLNIKVDPETPNPAQQTLLSTTTLQMPDGTQSKGLRLVQGEAMISNSQSSGTLGGLTLSSDTTSRSVVAQTGSDGGSAGFRKESDGAGSISAEQGEVRITYSLRRIISVTLFALSSPDIEPQSALAPLETESRTIVLKAGEVARFDSSGELLGVFLGSLSGTSGKTGDRMPLPHSPGVISPATTLRFEGGNVVGRIGGLFSAFMNSQMNGALRFEQRADGLLRITNGGNSYVARPVGGFEIVSGVADGSSYDADGNVRLTFGGIRGTYQPVLDNAADLAQILGQAALIDLGADGLVRTVGGPSARFFYVARPRYDVLPADGSARGMGTVPGAPGARYHVQANGTRQVLDAAFHDESQWRAAAVRYGWTVARGTNGSNELFVTDADGRRSRVVPEFVVEDLGPGATAGGIRSENGKLYIYYQGLPLRQAFRLE